LNKLRRLADITANGPVLMGLEEIAAYVRYPVEYIKTASEDGLFPAWKERHTWRALKPAIDKWLLARSAANVSG